MFIDVFFLFFVLSLENLFKRFGFICFFLFFKIDCWKLENDMLDVINYIVLIGGNFYS